METYFENSPHEVGRAALQEMVLATEKRIQELHKDGGGNAQGDGVVEVVTLFPAPMQDFVGDAENKMTFTPEELVELNRLIPLVAQGLLDEESHRDDLERFVDLFARYQEARNSQAH